MPVSLDLLKTHWSEKRFPCYRNKLLRNLVTDHSQPRSQSFGDKILGSLRLLLSMPVKSVDENVGVEKVPSGAHSSLRA